MTIRGMSSPTGESRAAERRYTPRAYSRAAGVSKETVYAWITGGKLPTGARAEKSATNRYVIHVDEAVHPQMPIYTEAR